MTYLYDQARRLTDVTDFDGNQIAITDNADGDPATEALGATGDTITTGYDRPACAVILGRESGCQARPRHGGDERSVEQPGGGQVKRLACVRAGSVRNRGSPLHPGMELAERRPQRSRATT